MERSNIPDDFIDEIIFEDQDMDIDNSSVLEDFADRLNEANIASANNLTKTILFNSAFVEPMCEESNAKANKYQQETSKKSDTYSLHENQIAKDRKIWEELLVAQQKALRENKNAKDQKHIAEQLLTSEDRNYLLRAPCLQNFIHESLAFRSMANIFLHTHVEEMEEVQAIVLEACERRLSKKLNNKIAMNLANKKSTPA